MPGQPLDPLVPVEASASAVPGGASFAFDREQRDAPASPDAAAAVRDACRALLPEGEPPPGQVGWLADDHTVRRYLAANKGAVGPAGKQLAASLAWRESRGLVDGAAHAPDHHCNSFLPIGLDRRRHVVIYSCHARAVLPSNVNAEETFDHAFQVSDMACDDVAGIQRTLWVIDFNGFSTKHICKRHISLGCAWFGAHNPERLGALVLRKPPRIFTALWSFIHLFLDPESAKRIVVCRNDEEYEAYLRDACANDTTDWLLAVGKLPPSVGGGYPPGTDLRLVGATMWAGPPTAATLARVAATSGRLGDAGAADNGGGGGGGGSGGGGGGGGGGDGSGSDKDGGSDSVAEGDGVGDGDYGDDGSVERRGFEITPSAPASAAAEVAAAALSVAAAPGIEADKEASLERGEDEDEEAGRVPTQGGEDAAVAEAAARLLGAAAAPPIGALPPPPLFSPSRRRSGRPQGLEKVLLEALPEAKQVLPPGQSHVVTLAVEAADYVVVWGFSTLPGRSTPAKDVAFSVAFNGTPVRREGGGIFRDTSVNAERAQVRSLAGSHGLLHAPPLALDLFL